MGLNTHRVLQLLVRKTSGRQFIPEIDGLRSLAVLSVLFFHCGMIFSDGTHNKKAASDADQLFASILKTGEIGVPLFFAISGFILAIPFASHHLKGSPSPSIKKYLLRRVTRLEPPYLVCLLTLFIGRFTAAIYSGSDESSPLSVVKHALGSMFYLHRPIFGLEGMPSSVFWSLEIEVQFYLLAPFICMIFILPAFYRRSIMVVLGVGSSYLWGVEHPIMGSALPHQFSYFLAGILLSDFYLTSLNEKPSQNIRWDFIATAALVSVFGFKHAGVAVAMVSPWLIFIGYYAVFKSVFVRRIFAFPPLVVIGGMCYSIYLWHQVLLRAYFKFVHSVIFAPEQELFDRVVFVLLGCIVVIPICTLLYVLIERPTMDPKWPQKLAARLPFLKKNKKTPVARK